MGVPGELIHKRKRGPRPKDFDYHRAKGTYDKHPDRDPERGRVSAGVKPKIRDYAGLAERYAADVVGGLIPACSLTVASCRRHLFDLKAAREDPDYPYDFKPLLAARACGRIETLRHVKGKWAGRGERIKLEPWQCFVIVVPFGWVERATGTRRFRRSYLRIPRKNAKSTLSAGLGVYMQAEDGEFGAEVYAGATTEVQAWEVFGPAKRMLERDKDLCSGLGIEVWAKALIRPEDNSVFKPVIGKPGDGASPSFAIIDEFHEHQTPDQVNTMITGMGAREQPMLWVITTAGDNMAGPCFDMDLEAQDVLLGKAERPDFFAMIYTVDEGDDWTSVEALEKANPNIGVSVSREFLIAAQRDAVQNTRNQNRFRTKHLDIWVGAAEAAINVEEWKACHDPRLADREWLRGKAGVKALDLASKIDVCANMDVAWEQREDGLHYFALSRFYMPRKTVDEAGVNGDSYRAWARAGHLNATEGAEVDFSVVREDVLEDKTLYQIVEIAYDAWRATQLAHECAAKGATVVEISQTAAHLGEPFDELLTAIIAGRFHHDGNPVLTWMAGNVVKRKAMKGVYVPSKEKDEKKIDGIVAIVMAIARILAHTRGSKPPDYQVFVL